MSQHKNEGILLESGTNELEIVEFGVGSGTFGINVIKVREIVNPLKITKLPNSHPAVEGLIQLRGSVLPVVDLAQVLGMPSSEQPEHDKLIVAEFNQMKVAFHVHSVSRIHRISWEQIEKPSEMTRNDVSTTIGIVKMDDRIILLLDYEKIVVDISPEAGINTNQLKTLGPRERSNKRILVAEDSAVLRKLLQETLTAAGYGNLHIVNDGKIAWDYLEKIAADKKDKVVEDIQLVITDIEMPQMDGHHLTKRIKSHSFLQKLPVVIFSSLITDDLRHKGEGVGADEQISKPDIANLVKVIDQLIL